MADYRISGVWKDAKGTITHYAFHTVTTTGTTRATKTTKAQAVSLLETNGSKALTWIWNYSKAEWKNGETVEVVNGSNEKYLRTNPSSSLTDNLDHLIDFDWITP